MCIVLLTTGHPDYALIVINNRDEFVVRPTSRPHWWTPSSASTLLPPDENDASSTADSQSSKPPEILSSRDLNRPERGTWLGVTKSGRFACLTNYREPAASADAANAAAHPVHGIRSRGAIVSSWLGSPDPAERTSEFVTRILSGGGVKGVGGFSLICGQLSRRRRHSRGAEDEASASTEDGKSEPLAVISNRSEHPDRVPWIVASRGETHGLSNAAFDSDAPPWPKVQMGKKLLDEAVERSIASSSSEDDLITSLFSVLDSDTLPRLPADAPFEDYIPILRQSIFVPALGGEARVREMAAFGEAARKRHVEEAAAAAAGGATGGAVAGGTKEPPSETHPVGAKPADEGPMGFMTGIYGTQRQTVILVGWDGTVRYTERALWDEYGGAIARGEGDMTIRFRIDGWEEGEGGEQKNTGLENGSLHC